jgi:Arc/MetJ-type ribon-helix-helix transcriptional regulator
MAKISVRLNETLLSFVRERSRKLHGGDVSDYLRFLIQEDMKTNDPIHRYKELRKMSDDLDGSLNELQSYIDIIRAEKTKIDEAAIPPPR